MPERLEERPVHLGRSGSAVVEPPFAGGPEWYEAYGARRAADGAEGRLVSMFRFSKSWDAWEMHPAGEEVVLCLSGRMTLHQEHAGGRREQITISSGEYAINPAGTWHTADIDFDRDGEAEALFITAGLGTETRPRQTRPRQTRPRQTGADAPPGTAL